MTKLTRVVTGTLIALAMLMVPRTAAAAPLLQLDGNGMLLGAQNVSLDGQLFDVQFVDLTCNGIFSGCNELIDFDFTSESAALGAAQALLDQVLTGVYDTFPERVAGCASTFSCAILIPYSALGDMAAVAVAYNLSNDIADSTGLSFITRSENTKQLAQLVFANWSPSFQETGVGSTETSVAPVPEPASLILLGTGLAAAASAARRRNKRQAEAEELPAA